MKIRNHDAWEAFTYKLLYPAVLGSMIYDAANWQVWLDFLGAAKLCIVVLFCLDYLHLYMDLRSAKQGSPSCVTTLIDAAIPVLFCFMYWSISYESFRSSLLFLLLISVLMFVYIPPKAHFTLLYFVGKGILVSLVLIFIYVSYRRGFRGGQYFAAFYFICTLWYAVHMFWISEYRKKRA